ncbi:hypothetical protein NN561_001641 [Cricetulus griseus]
MLPSCQVTLIENKELSLIRAKKRSDELGLSNIWFIQANMEYFTGMFNIGVALHACGVATDMVIEHCVQTRASFITCPCCYGFIQNTSKFNFPKSEKFKKTLSYKEHMILCRFADQTAVQLPPQRRLIGKKCMCLVDMDRATAAEEHGYSVQVLSMEPESCSPKNNMIVAPPLAGREPEGLRQPAADLPGCAPRPVRPSSCGCRAESNREIPGRTASRNPEHPAPRPAGMAVLLAAVLASSLYLQAAADFDGRWPRQIVSSIGLCRYGGRIDCCWGWARQSWGQCQREYRSGGSRSWGVYLSTMVLDFTLHFGGFAIAEQFLAVQI